MTLRRGFLCLLLSVAASLAGDGIDPRGAAADYPAHMTSGKIEIGAAYVTPAQVRKVFGDDLDRRGFVVFEIGMFPPDGAQIDIAADDFKLRQGKDLSLVRALTPHAVAIAVHPQPPTNEPSVPNKVTVTSTETIGYQHGSYGNGGVYTDSRVGVAVGQPNAPAPPPPAAAGGNDQISLEQQLQEKALPETKTRKPVAGYIFFPKPMADKRADFELVYFGMDGQASLKLSPAAKP